MREREREEGREKERKEGREREREEGGRGERSIICVLGAFASHDGTIVL